MLLQGYLIKLCYLRGFYTHRKAWENITFFPVDTMISSITGCMAINKKN